jgi:hypothetical protein
MGPTEQLRMECLDKALRYHERTLATDDQVLETAKKMEDFVKSGKTP